MKSEYKPYRKPAAILCLLLAAFLLHADMMYSPTWDYAVDLPEGFVLSQKNGTDAYLFEHSQLPATVVLRAYPLSRYATAEKAMKDTMSKLSADYETCNVSWRGNDCTVAQFNMTATGSAETGWGVASPLVDDKGIIVMLAYSPVEYEAQMSQFIISCVDSLLVDRGSYYSPGPITTFAFPEQGAQNVSLTIANVKMNIQLDASDVEADSFVIEREYDVLCLYQQSDLWVEAWQRYYRQIFKNEYSRLEKAAFTIQNKLSRKLKDETLIPQTLLSWTQGFKYERQTTDSDFSPVTSILMGDGSDCDSRSMLLAILLGQMGYDTCIFVSAEYSHAMLGIELDKSGAKMKLGNHTYLLGETTAQVNIGLVAQDMCNPDKWIGVDFAFFDD